MRVVLGFLSKSSDNDSNNNNKENVLFVSSIKSHCYYVSIISRDLEAHAHSSSLWYSYSTVMHFYLIWFSYIVCSVRQVKGSIYSRHSVNEIEYLRNPLYYLFYFHPFFWFLNTTNLLTVKLNINSVILNSYSVNFVCWWESNILNIILGALVDKCLYCLYRIFIFSISIFFICVKLVAKFRWYKNTIANFPYTHTGKYNQNILSICSSITEIVLSVLVAM